MVVLISLLFRLKKKFIYAFWTESTESLYFRYDITVNDSLQDQCRKMSTPCNENLHNELSPLKKKDIFIL